MRVIWYCNIRKSTPFRLASNRTVTAAVMQWWYVNFSALDPLYLVFRIFYSLSTYVDLCEARLDTVSKTRCRIYAIVRVLQTATDGCVRWKLKWLSALVLKEGGDKLGFILAMPVNENKF